MVNKYSCAALKYLRTTSALFNSAFLVLCLCVARTISLIRPFKKQKVRYFAIAMIVFVALNLIPEAISYALRIPHEVKFDNILCICFLQFDKTSRYIRFKEDYIRYAFFSFLVLAQAMTVIVSCIISVVVLTRKNKNVQQRELQQSRNRATVTILLFALLYGVCNIPYVLYVVMWRLHVVTGKPGFIVPYLFDTKFYYTNAIMKLLPAANSALNPILYFWRMKPLREYTVTSVKKILRLNKVKVRRPPANNEQLK